MSTFVWVSCVHQGWWGTKERAGFLEMELDVGCELCRVVLGTKPFSERAEITLHQGAISSPTISLFSSSFLSVKFFILRLLLQQKWQGNLLNIMLVFTFIWAWVLRHMWHGVEQMKIKVGNSECLLARLGRLLASASPELWRD